MSLYDRLIGRFCQRTLCIRRPERCLPQLMRLMSFKAEKIVGAGITEVEVRSVLTCETRHGVCVMLWARSRVRAVQVGEVGTVAAQSIGEPGTRLPCVPSTAASPEKRLPRVCRGRGFRTSEAWPAATFISGVLTLKRRSCVRSDHFLKATKPLRWCLALSSCNQASGGSAFP